MTYNQATNFMTNCVDKSGKMRVETHRFGPFIFQVGIDTSSIIDLLSRVEDAYMRFYATPLFNELSDNLEQISLVSAVYSTNTIEGATLSEKETEETISLSSAQIQNENQQRVLNLKNAYNKIKTMSQNSTPTSKSTATITEKFIRELHETVCHNLSAPKNNLPGLYRKEIKGFHVRVGDENHGGVYTPPQCRDDITKLVHHLADFANSQPLLALPALLRAPLIHYYFELIHPFQDGNGRVGRLIETYLLETGNYHYVSKAMSAFYLKNIDKYYALFNECRKSAQKKTPMPNTAFVEFFLEGMLHTINRLQDTANTLISNYLNYTFIKTLQNEKKINTRQAYILNQLLSNDAINTLQKLSNELWYKALYKNMSIRTQQRDIEELLKKTKLLMITHEGKLQLSQIKPLIKLFENPKTSPK